MRLTSIAFAVASLGAAALSSPAQAYCRGCAMSPEAAAAAAAGAVYGSAIAAGAAAQAYEPPPPMPNSSASYGAANTRPGDSDCKSPVSRTFVAGSNIPAARIDKCE
ncbi:MAG: hypothetical protein AB7O50_03455 [Pseudolabrys sp.]